MTSRSRSRSRETRDPGRRTETQPLIDKRVTIQVPQEILENSTPFPQDAPLPIHDPDVVESRQRWKDATEKISAYNRLRRASSFVPRGPPGTAAGLDVHAQLANRRDLQAFCNITVVDYSQDHIEIRANLSNEQFLEFVKLPRPSWSKVRWISVSGMSWDVISSLANLYQLHPLAVEDACHIPQRVKVDYFEHSLYVSTLHVRYQPVAQVRMYRQPMERTASGGYLPRASLPSLSIPKSVSRGIISQKRSDQRLLTPMARQRVNAMHVDQVALFVTEDATVISLFENDGEDVVRPLLDRLGQNTMLRNSEDSSFLLYAILDTLVDQFLDVAEKYNDDLEEVQVSTIRQPRAANTRELFLIQGELVALQRMIAPFRGMITSLQTDRTDGERWDPVTRTTGFYLGDVSDHVLTCLETIESLERQCQELTSYIFNLTTHQTNEIMRSLTTVSLIFLPLSFLTGLYGTNWVTHFPPLDWEWGWLWFVGLCLFIAIFTILVMINRGVIRPYDPAS